MLYPSTIELTAESVVELRDIILHYLGGEDQSFPVIQSLKQSADFMTSQYSTSPYNVNDLNTMLGQVNNLRSESARCSHGLTFFNHSPPENVGYRSPGAVSMLSEFPTSPGLRMSPYNSPFLPVQVG